MALPQVVQRHCELTFIHTDNGCKRLPTLGLYVPFQVQDLTGQREKTTSATDCLNDKQSQIFLLSFCKSLELASSFCENPKREKRFSETKSRSTGLVINIVPMLTFRQTLIPISKTFDSVSCSIAHF